MTSYIQSSASLIALFMAAARWLETEVIPLRTKFFYLLQRVWIEITDKFQFLGVWNVWSLGHQVIGTDARSLWWSHAICPYLPIFEHSFGICFLQVTNDDDDSYYYYYHHSQSWSIMMVTMMMVMMYFNHPFQCLSCCSGSCSCQGTKRQSGGATGWWSWKGLLVDLPLWKISIN